VSEASIQIAGDFSPSADLAVAYRRHMESLVHQNGPSANTRASSIGNACERYIVYERTVPAEDRTRYSPELQAIFELGRDMEKIVLRRLEDMGAEIVQRGRDYLDRRYELSGHIDAKIRMPGWPRALTTEIKGLNPYTGDSIASLSDIKDSRQVWVRKYYDQLQTYLLLEGEELGAFVLFNKSTGWPTFIDCPLDYHYAEWLLQKSERVKLHVAQQTLPDRHLSKDCSRCQFVAVCAPDIDMGDGAQWIEDSELEALIRRREELEPAAAEFRAVDKTLKQVLPPKSGEYLVGDFVVTRKLQSRDAYRVEKTSFYVNDIRRISDVKPK
jgi:hypothetical protein